MSTPLPVSATNAGRLKHLEMIQAVIARMAGNGFLIKGWSVTLLSAILALAVKDRIYAMIWVALVPCLTFWGLDGYFLWQERAFRRLWDIKSREEQTAPTDFDMVAKDKRQHGDTWWRAVWSRTLLAFHGSLLTVVVIVIVGIGTGVLAQPVAAR